MRGIAAAPPGETVKPHVLLGEYVRRGYAALRGQQEAGGVRLSAMTDWYTATYRDGSRENASKNRDVNFDRLAYSGKSFDDEYTFSNLYSTQIFDRSLTGLNKPTYVFILHVSVAFKLTAEQCDELLRAHGYMRLHSRNIFHLAVYAVLKKMETERLSGDKAFLTDFTQFELIKKLVREALAILAEGDGRSDEPALAAAGDAGVSTMLWSEFKKRITYENFLDFIRSRRAELNHERSKLRREYFRLAGALMWLYDSGDRYEHSFRGFLLRFCKSMDDNHYHEYLHGHLKKDTDKQPTREIMIILWIWEFCFRCFPLLRMSSDAVLEVYSKICRDSLDSEKQKFIRKWKSREAPSEPMKREMSERLYEWFGCGFDRDAAYSTVDVARLLGTEGYPPEDAGELWGELCFAAVNARLERFGMGQLNARVDFDRRICSLRGMRFRADRSGERHIVDALYEHFEALAEAESAHEKGKLLLECSTYKKF